MVGDPNGSKHREQLNGCYRGIRACLYRLRSRQAVDTTTNTARIQEQVIPLQGVNVLLIDEVDSPSVRVAGTLWVNPKMPPFPQQDPVDAIIKQSPVLMDYVGG